MSKPKKANFFVKRVVTTVFVVPEKVTVKIGDGGDAVVTTVFVVPKKVTVKIGDGGDAGIKIY